MDDEAIPCRDAIAGLGLMGTLLVALVSTIGIRIANSSRDKAGPPRHSTAIAATTEGAPLVVAIEAKIDASRTSNPVTSEDLAKVQQATHEQIAPLPPASERTAPAPAPAAGSSAPIISPVPRFIAPSGS
jgi:hypothetical protein